MNYSTNCPFCLKSRFENNKLANLPADETLLFENQNVYVQVDISPLTIGHILIIPNHHYLNFYEMPREIKEDVAKLKNSIRRLYRTIYNADVLFCEHGTAEAKDAGSGVDHAHLHCIPLFNDRINIIQSLNEQLGTPIDNDILEKDDYNNEYSYIYVETAKTGKLFYKVNQLPSQFLRKLVLEKLGGSKFLWQEKCITPNSLDNLRQTILDLRGKISL